MSGKIRCDPSPALATVAAGNVLDLLRKVARVGGNPEHILAQARVPFTLADLAENRPPYIARRHLTAIYRESITTIGLYSSRLDRKPQMHPDEFRLMCYCIITCRTLAEVIERQALFFRTRADQICEMTLAEADTGATVWIDTLRRRKGFGSFLSDLAGMSIYCRLYGWLIGTGAHEFRVRLGYGSAYADEAVEDFFTGDLQFGGKVNSISFPRRLLTMPIVRTADDLEKLLEEFPFDFLSGDVAAVPLPDRIQAIYAGALVRDREMPSLATLAELTGQGVSTLRRRLAEAGVSITALKLAARGEMAMGLLKERRLPIEEIAARTGFRDTDSFRIAFRRWSGMTPSAYRRRLMDTPSD